MEHPNTYIEHTLLKIDLTDREVDQLISEAKRYQFIGVCIPPFWVKKVSRELENSTIQLVTVIGFPLGYQQTASKLHEIEMAIADGADELDLVMNVSAFKSGMNWSKIEMAKAAQLAHQQQKILKIIVETALLTKEEIAQVSKIVSDAGADYIKTSTGFASRGASIDDIEIMKANVAPHVGIKASGGIKSREQLEALVNAGADRIGTSAGVQIMKAYE
ncbi:deoxyribose-phosphate aldolase [Reichenbachiella carrageenanivorans]|uniref:Deoxyribose-phosphate aldolase n=1 Tax=Reichenbachiella carrageenanivorans TaxID=2979869 RepID=A0ABY6D874_9BACT|nr:deoxyribose-phosphate aldolase [Reichenbachiella carrageenanivorans]UXX81378.1 deoxyribose-phosphate aldolase [Reichenbachiella carrageenanivorans]